MGEPQRLRPMPPDRRATDEPGGVAPGAPDRGGQDRLPSGGHAGQPVGAEERPAGVGGAWEPLPQRRSNPRELGGTSGDRDDRHAERAIQRVEIEDVEPAHHRPVEEDRPDAIERAKTPDERNDPPRTVGAVDAHATGTDRLHVLGKRHGHGRHRSVAVPALERTVVDTDHSRVRLPERTPQR